MLSTNEIQLVNFLKNGAGSNNQQRNSINVVNNEKKQLVVRESLGNNSQLHNTKQIIKLIKKSDAARDQNPLDHLRADPTVHEDQLTAAMLTRYCMKHLKERASEDKIFTLPRSKLVYLERP